MELPQSSPGSDAGQPAVSQPAVQPQAAPAAAPSQPQAPATNNPPVDGQTPQGQQAANTELYSLPDGRQVDAATLAKEWKENWMPDYTQKSQMLAQMQQGRQVVQQPNINNNPQQPQAQTPVWQDPNWIPQTYTEIIDAAAQKMQYDARMEAQQREQYTQQVNQFVDSQISEIKKLEPNLSEELLFQHANKYGFSDLMAAYKNMQDYNVAVKRAEQQTLQNLQTRANDPISVRQGQQTPSNAVDYRSIQDKNLSALDMLKRIQGK